MVFCGVGREERKWAPGRARGDGVFCRGDGVLCRGDGVLCRSDGVVCRSDGVVVPGLPRNPFFTVVSFPKLAFLRLNHYGFFLR